MHEHIIYDNDPHFKIDIDTRAITNMSEVKTALMQGDHKSERFTFEMPRYKDGHDMSESMSCRIHFINIGNANSETNPGVYEVDDLHVSETDAETIVFSWLITSAVTKLVGSLNFAMEFSCYNEDRNETIYSWHTGIHTGITVSNTINNSETIVEDYVDILEQWRQELFGSVPKVSIEQTEHGATISITDSTGPTTAEIQNGKSAYEIAVEYGYVGTEEEWNNLIQTEREAAVQAIQTKSEEVTATFNESAQQKGNEVLESLPDDYTQMQNDLRELSENKLDKNQGAETSGKYMKVGPDGEITPSSIDRANNQEIGGFKAWNTDGSYIGIPIEIDPNTGFAYAAANVSDKTEDDTEYSTEVKRDPETKKLYTKNYSKEISSLSEEIDILNQGGLNLKEDFIGSQVDEWLDLHPESTTTVKDGSIEEVKFSDELRKRKASYYNSVAKMKLDASLKDGMTAVTLGYYEPNDGGGATYIIRANTGEEVDNMGNIELDNGNISSLIESKKNANPLQWGVMKDNENYIDQNSMILSYLLKKNYKIILKSGIYYFRNIDLTGVSNVNIEGEYGRHLYSDNITIIRTLGYDFLCKHDNFNVDFWLKNLTIYSAENSGVCIGSSVKDDREINFHIENCGVSNFEYGVLSYTYASNTQVEDSTFIQNKYGIYIGKTCNVGLFRRLSLNFNLYGFTGGGAQCVMENIHIGYGSPIQRDDGIYGYGIYATKGTSVKHVYTESYGSNIDYFSIYKIDASNNNNLDTVYFEDASFPKTSESDTLYNLYVSGEDEIMGYNNLLLNKCRINDIKVFMENENDLLKGINLDSNKVGIYDSSWIFNDLIASIVLNENDAILKDANYGINVKEITYDSSCIQGYSKLVGAESTENLSRYIYDKENKRINIYDFSKKKINITALFSGLESFVGSKISLGVYINPIINNSTIYGRYIESKDFYIQNGSMYIEWYFEIKTQGRFNLFFKNTDGYIVPSSDNFKMNIEIS